MHSLYSITRPKRAYLRISDPEAKDNSGDRRFELQFNPETLTRQLDVAEVQEQTGQGRSRGYRGKAERGGTLGEPTGTMTITIRLDHGERQADAGSNAELGLLPDLAALESLVHPLRFERDKADDGKRLKPLRVFWPAVVLIWGQREFPVRVTSVTINELLHDSNLVPLRAEVELSMEVRPGGRYRQNKAGSEQIEHHEQRMQWNDLYYDKGHKEGP